MKKCQCCGHVAPADAPTCAHCGEASWMPAALLFGIAVKDNGFAFPIDVYRTPSGYHEHTMIGLVPYSGEVFADDAQAKRAADAVNVPLGRGPAWPEVAPAPIEPVAPGAQKANRKRPPNP